MRDGGERISLGRLFSAKGTASAKTLRSEPAQLPAEVREDKESVATGRE